MPILRKRGNLEQFSLDGKKIRKLSVFSYSSKHKHKEKDRESSSHKSSHKSSSSDKGIWVRRYFSVLVNIWNFLDWEIFCPSDKSSSKHSSSKDGSSSSHKSSSHKSSHKDSHKDKSKDKERSGDKDKSHSSSSSGDKKSEHKSEHKSHSKVGSVSRVHLGSLMLRRSVGRMLQFVSLYRRCHSKRYRSRIRLLLGSAVLPQPLLVIESGF